MAPVPVQNPLDTVPSDGDPDIFTVSQTGCAFLFCACRNTDVETLLLLLAKKIL